MITVDRKHNGMLDLWYFPDGSTSPIRNRYMGFTESQARREFAEHLRSMGIEVEA
jgi:hypothetical protein|tara:strand:- start:632 stop:796 length:165 start_codon:yes stop_codon:yes gene_type:complete